MKQRKPAGSSIGSNRARVSRRRTPDPPSAPYKATRTEAVGLYHMGRLDSTIMPNATCGALTTPLECAYTGYAKPQHRPGELRATGTRLLPGCVHTSERSDHAGRRAHWSEVQTNPVFHVLQGRPFMSRYRHRTSTRATALQYRAPTFSAYKVAAWLAFLATLVTLLAAWPVARAATPPSNTQLSVSLPSGQPVGTSIALSARSAGPANPVYRFSVGSAPNAMRVVQDFSPTPSFTWVPLQEGAYTIQVTVKDGFAATAGTTPRAGSS